MIAGSIEIQLLANVARLQRDMDQARQIVGQTTTNLTRMALAVKDALGGMLGGFSLAALGSQVIGAQREFDKLNASLITATGSGADAAQTFKALQTFAAATPYGVADATEAFIKLKNLGLDPSQAALRSYGNTAAAMGKGLNQMVEAVADAATGEFERLKEFGITAAQSGDKVALTFKGVTTTIGKNATDIQAYLKKIGDTDFAGAMALRAATLDGAISNLSDSWDAFLLRMSQSGIGSAAASGIALLANNLDLLAGSVMSVTAAKLASTMSAWLAKTREEIAASVAARAANLASAEAAVADATAKVSQLTATQGMIVVAREEAVAKLASANSNITAAQAAIAAATAAGAQSFALRTVRLATAELSVAEAQRAAMVAELAILGRQQASVSAQVTAALGAQAAAQAALNGTSAAGGVAAGVASRALGLLGGPIGLVITALGLAATAWSVWGNAAQDANEKVAKSVDETAPELLGRLDDEIKKLKERKALLEARPAVQSASEKDQSGIAALQADLKAINEYAGEYATQSQDLHDLRVRIVTRQITEALEKVKNKEQETKAVALAGDATLIAVRQRLTGVNQQYLDDLEKYQAALSKGAISQEDYAAAVKKLATDAFSGSEAGKDYAKSLDLTGSAIARQAEARSLLNAREQEHIQFLKNTGQIDEEEAIKRATKAQVDALKIEKDAAAGQLALAYKKADNQKEQADLAGKIGAINIKISNAQKKGEEDLIALEQQRYQAAVGASADWIEKQMAELASLQQQTQAQEDYNAQIGLTPKQIAEITAARLRDAAARKDIEADIAEGFDLDGATAARVRAQAAELRKQADGAVAGAVKQEMFDKNLQDANALVQIMSALDEAAQSAAQGMADSFGRVGEAIGGLTTAMSGYAKTQAAIAAQQAASLKDAAGDPEKIQRANTLAAEASAQAQVKSYGDMAKAAKGFFKENTAGYRAMEGVEKTYRAFEMALSLKTMAEKLGLLTTYTAAHATAKATETAATQASVAPDIAASMAKGQAAAAAGVAGQAQGDPYSAWARMAAMAAVMAALGFAVSGGGSSPSLAEQRQAAQGAGTVLGDSSAKSQSIARAIELSAANSSTQIDYLAGMLMSLRTIESGISSFASQIVRSTDLTDPKYDVGGNAPSWKMVNSMAQIGIGAGFALGGPIGAIVGGITGWLATKIPIIGSLGNALFGGKKSVDDSGFTMDKATLATILSQGAKANQYYDIKTSGGYFSHSSHDVIPESLGPAANQQFTLILKGMADSITQAAGILGVSGQDFESRLNSFVVNIGMISLKGLKADEIQSKLEEVFSKVGDQMASWAVSAVNDFAKAGEGPLETLVRVASEYAKVDASLQSIGKTFGSVGLASIAARENLISLMGGIDEFQSQTAGFASNFLTKAEQLAPVAKFVDQQLAALGLTGITTRDQFKQLVLGLDLTTAAGQKQYAALMSLQEAFAATHAATVDLSKTEQEVADEKKDLQDQLDQLTMTQTQLLQKQRYALAEANRPLFDMIQAAQKLADTSSSMTKFRDAAKSLNDSLLTGSLSVLTPEQQYAELRSQYEKTKAAALAGDTTAQDQVFNALNAWLQASQKLNSGDSQYQADFALAQQDSSSMAAWASGQVDTAKAQLDAMNSQTAALATVNTALDMANTILTKISQNTAPVTGGANVLGGALSALTMAINALKQDNAKLTDQVAGLRKDQQAQTGDTITSNAETQQSAADRIVSGVTQAVSRLATNQKVTLE